MLFRSAARAAPLLRRAALVAARRQQYRRALALAERSGLLRQDAPGEALRTEADLLFALLGCLSDLGDHKRAEALLARIDTAAVSARDEGLLRRVAVWRADLEYWRHNLALADRAPLEAAVADMDDSPDRGRGCLLLGYDAQCRGDSLATEAWLRRADAIFEGDRKSVV